MLNQAALVAFVPSTDMQAAREFYEQRLGLTFLGEDRFAVVFDANGVMLRITNVTGVPHTPAGFTILGWSVNDIVASVGELTAKGVIFQRYDGLGQDPQGIWTSPSGAKVAWFRDPDSNVLSITEIGQPS